MKLSYFEIGITTLVITAACSLEEMPTVNPVQQKEITIQAVAPEEGPATRTIRLDNGNIWWTPGDQISVFYGSGADGGSCFTAQIEENKRIANFTGTIGVITGGGDIAPEQTFFWGLYPYNSTAECDGTTIVTDVPDCQTAVPGTFAPGTYPWIGRSQGLLMSFYGLCGGIKFTVNKEGIKKATLKTADGSAIAGRVRIALDANSIPSVQEIIDGRDEIVLEAPDGEYFIPGKPYFFVTLPHNFDTSFFTVKFETFTEEGTYERKRALEIKRADFINFSSALDGKVTYEKKTGAIPVEDPAFKAYLVENYDTDGNGEISYEEAAEVREINILPSNDHNLQSLRGIEYMPNLEVIDCWGDWYDTGDKSTGIDREHYYVGPYRNNWETVWGPIGTLKYVDVTNNPKLRKLNVCSNSALGVELGAVDVSHNPLLEELQLGMTWLEYPDISNNSHLKIINFSHLRGTLPSFANLPELQALNIEYPQDEDNVQAHDIDVSGSPLLEELILSNTARSLSDLSHNPKLRVLHWTFCGAVGPIDLSVLPDLEVLGVVGCQLTELDITHNPKLRVLYADDNPLKSIDFSNNSALEELHLSHTLLGDNERGSVDLSPLSNLQYLSCDVTGITALDVTHNPHLQELRCWLNSLTELDLSHNPELKYLFCDENQIASLPLSANTQLEYINCLGNRLTELDLSALSKLCCIDCRNNFITTLDVSRNPLLGTGIWDGQRVGLYCSPMNDAEGNNLLETLFIADGQTIPNVTENRSDDHVPAETVIRIAPTTGTGEGSTTTPTEP